MKLEKKYLLKSLTWRVVSVILSFVLSLYFFGAWRTALNYTLAYGAISTVLYYIHELLYKRFYDKRKN